LQALVGAVEQLLLATAEDSQPLYDFSKVSFLPNLRLKIPLKLIFEKFHQASAVAAS